MTKHALLVIDMQNAYFRNKALADKRSIVVENSNRLIECSSKNNIPIFLVMTEHEKDQSTWTLNMKDDKQGYLFSGDIETQTLDELRKVDYMIVRKTRDSSFFGTDLALNLKNAAIDTLIISGVSTHSCILLTAADAYANNFRVILATDAIASHDPSYHEMTLKMLEQEYRQKLHSTKEVMTILESTK